MQLQSTTTTESLFFTIIISRGLSLSQEMIPQRGLGWNKQMQKFTWSAASDTSDDETMKVHSIAAAQYKCTRCCTGVVIDSLSILTWTNKRANEPDSLLWFNTLRSRCHSSFFGFTCWPASQPTWTTRRWPISRRTDPLPIFILPLSSGQTTNETRRGQELKLE